MLHHLTRFFRSSPETEHAYAFYALINQASRSHEFFVDWGVPDTLDGRFEMILLHMFLYLHSLKQRDTDTTELQRRIIEAFFEDMDRSIREIGVTDTGVSRRIKAMANAFYGRIHAFETGLQDEAQLAEAIRKNIFGTLKDQPEEKQVAMVVEYIYQQLETLKLEPMEQPEWVNRQWQESQAG